MGRDVPDGAHVPAQRAARHRLAKRKASDAYFERLRNTSRDFADGARRSLRATTRCGSCRRVITVHPLGGAPMGRDAGEGVVDAVGQRLRPPRPAHRRRLGDAGPDRAEPQLHDRGAGRPLRRPDHRSRPTRRGGGRLMTSSVRFTEEMLGHVTFGEPDFARGAQPSRDGSERSSSTSRSRSPTSRRFCNDPLRPAGAIGYLQCDALGGRLPVEQGCVQPLRRRRAGRQAHALPALVPRRRRPPADDDRLQAGQERRRLRRLEGHDDAVHARAARARRRGRRRRRRAGRVRHHRDPGAGLRQAADDVPRRRAGHRPPSSAR